MDLKENKGCLLSILYVLLTYLFVVVFSLVMNHYFKKEHDLKYIDKDGYLINSIEEDIKEDFEEEYDPSYYTIRDY